MTSLAELEDSARALSQRGDIQAATRVCQDILAIDQNHIPSLRFLADLAINASDFRAATGYLTTLLKNAPDNLQVLTQLGQALYQQGKLEEAVAVYTDYWRISPGSGMIYLTLGCLHIECGNLDKAVQIFSLAKLRIPSYCHCGETRRPTRALRACLKSDGTLFAACIQTCTWRRSTPRETRSR